MQGFELCLLEVKGIVSVVYMFGAILYETQIYYWPLDLPGLISYFRGKRFQITAYFDLGTSRFDMH